MIQFNNPAAFTQGWYPALPSRSVRPASARTVEMLGRPVAIYRSPSGEVRALDARCPHLGADLGQGKVTDEGLRCWFHGWVFDAEGRCTSRRAVRTASYPIEERYGFVWLFNGPVPLFPLPQIPGFAMQLPAQTIRAHPNVIAGNGLDTSHYAALHAIRFLEEPQLEQPDRFHTRLTMRIAFAGPGMVDRVLRASGGDDAPAVFTTHGANLSTIDARLGRTAIRVLFSHSPLPDGSSRSRTFLFPESVGALPLVVASVMRIVGGDRKLLDRLDFQPNLTDSDWAFSAFVRQVEAMPVHPASALPQSGQPRVR